MPLVSVREVVPVDKDVLYAILADMSQFPQFMKNVESIEITERGDNYTLSRWVTRLQGAKFSWTERDTFYPQEGRITFTQLEGDLKVFQGEWRLIGVADGTEVTMETEFEFGIPMLATILNPIAKLALRDNARSMVRAIGNRAEPLNSTNSGKDGQNL